MEYIEPGHDFIQEFHAALHGPKLREADDKFDPEVNVFMIKTDNPLEVPAIIQFWIQESMKLNMKMGTSMKSHCTKSFCSSR